MKKLFRHIIVASLFISIFGVGFAAQTQTIHAQVAQCWQANGAGIPTAAIDNEALCILKGNVWGTTAPTATFMAAGAKAPQQKAAESPKGGGGSCGIGDIPACLADLALLVPAYVAGKIVLPLMGWLNSLSGLLLNQVIDATVIKMTDNIGGIGSIDSTWKVVRDVANMGFIFVLLYTAIMTMFGKGDYKRTIINMVIAALLINFSLFFTKVVIDAANLLSLVFYNAILGTPPAGSTILTYGLSNAIQQQLNLASIWKSAGLLDGRTLLTIGIMGSVFVLIATFVFVAISVMLIIRFVVLILVMILSPLMFIGMIIPNLGSYQKQWTNALIGQAFFAPAFFFMMLVVLQVGQSIGKGGDMAAALTGTTNGDNKILYNATSFGVLMNFSVTIIFLIAALLIAKGVAAKSGGAINKLTGQALGWSNDKFFGGLVGGTLRNTVGRVGDAASENAWLNDKAKNSNLGGRAASRLALYASRKARNGSFDARKATLPTDLGLGDTKLGRKLGLDGLRVGFGAAASTAAGAGKGGDKGFREISAADNERDRKEDEALAKERRGIDQKKKLADGAKAGERVAADTAAGRTLNADDVATVEAMEKTIATMTDKEIEAAAADNGKLLASQEFANKISVQQLEALNKSDKFTEAEKDTLKKNRFSAINAAGFAALAVPEASRTPDQKKAADTLTKAAKGLSDKELEMIDPDVLKKPAFIANLKSSQVDSMLKSNKFTGTQKKFIKDERKKPLINALDPANPAHDIDQARKLLSKMTDKDRAGLMDTEAPGAVPGSGSSVLTDPQVLPIYTPRMLKNMAKEMDEPDIIKLRTALTTAGAPLVGLPIIPGTPEENQLDTYNWLISPKGREEFR